MEQRERLFLNLGHTFGHAIEDILQDLTTEEYYRHGEAVSLGNSLCPHVQRSVWHDC